MLNALHPDLGHSYLALVPQDATPQWQADTITSHFPALSQANASSSASQVEDNIQPQPPNSTAVLAHAVVALHGLPANGQTASVAVFSCAHSLVSLLELTAAVIASSGVMHHTEQHPLSNMVAALCKLTPALLGCGSMQAEALRSVIREHNLALFQEREQQQSDEHQARMLHMCMAWTVCSTPVNWQ